MDDGTCEIWFVRHGQTDWNVDHRLQGHSDIALNELGKKQAEATAIYLQQFKFDHIVSSDLSRALNTAKEIQSNLNLDLTENSGLREHNLGQMEGYTPSNMPFNIHQHYINLRDDPDFNGHEGESSRDMSNRVNKILFEFSKLYNGKRILAITHGGFLYHVYHSISMNHNTTEKTPNASICIIQFNKKKWKIIKWGFIEHLNHLKFT